MAIISAQRCMNTSTRRTNSPLLCKFSGVFFRALLLVISFILAGTSVAMDTPASANDPASSTLAILFSNCNGDTPGFCPNGPFVKM